MSAAKSLFFLISATVVAVSISLVARPAFADGVPAPLEDHLTCYSVLEDSKGLEYLKVQLQNQFGLFDADIRVLARYFCTATAKVEANGAIQVLNSTISISPGDFVCYLLKTRAPGPGPIQVSDHYGDRTLNLGVARFLCAPAVRFTVE